MVPVAIPPANVRLAAEPKIAAATVGLVEGIGEGLAPEKVSDLTPLYPVATLLKASYAVTVIVWLAPATCVPEPLMAR